MPTRYTAKGACQDSDPRARHGDPRTQGGTKTLIRRIEEAFDAIPISVDLTAP